MATVTANYLPAAGRDFIDLTSWAGDAAFATTPVSGNQIEGPDTLTYGADGTITGPDGTYTLHQIIGATGAVESVSYTIGVPVDATAPTLSALTATGTDPDTIDVSVTTDEGNGTLYVYASANATESAATVKASAQGIQAVSATGAQTIALTLAVGSYYVHAMHEDAATNQSAVVSSTQVTLAVIPPATESASVTVNYIPPAGMSVTTLVDPIVHDIDSIPGAEWPSPAEVGEQIVYDPLVMTVDQHLNVSAEAEGVWPYFYINNAGDVYAATFTAQNLPEVPPEETEAPKGTWTIGAITVGQTSASLTPTYTGNDAESYEYSFNGSAWTTFTGTLSFSGLDPEASYGGAVRAVNSIGAGSPESFAFTTERVPVPPTVDTPLPDLNLSETAQVSISLDDYFSHATSYTVTGFPAGSGLSLAGRVITGKTNKTDTASSPFTLTVTATNADGSVSDAFSLTVVDDIAPVLLIYPLTTLNTSPLVMGSCDDAVSLTLVVNGVTYNPTPNNGAWSQQLPSLPLDTYLMTLNGQDAAGNVSEQAAANLRIVDQLPVTVSGVISNAIEPVITNSVEDAVA